MKSALAASYTFVPASKTIDFANVTGFDVRKLMAVINNTTRQLIYAPASPGYGYTAVTGTVVTLQFDTTGMNSGDDLMVLYDQDGVGDRNDAAASTDTGTFSLIALFKRFIQRVPTTGQKMKSGSTPVTLASDQVGSAGTPAADALSVQGVSGMTPLATDLNFAGAVGENQASPTATTILGRLKAVETAVYAPYTAMSGYTPDPASTPIGVAPPTVDSGGDLNTRSKSHTDEGSFRETFLDDCLNRPLTGTVQFTNGSTTVTGTGTAFTAEMYDARLYTKLAAHNESVWALGTVIDDETIELDAPYTGATASGAAHASHWRTSTGTGGTIAVSGAECTLSSGTTSGALTGLIRNVDYLPLAGTWYVDVSQRIANQKLVIGFQDIPGLPINRAVFIFTGTDNTQVLCRTGNDTGATKFEDTTITLPTGTTSADRLKFDVDLTAKKTVYSVNGHIVCVHEKLVPGPYTVMQMVEYVENTGVTASSTDMVIETCFVNNSNRVEVASSYPGDPLRQQLMAERPNGLLAPVGSDAHGRLIVTTPEAGALRTGFRFGEIATAATTAVTVRKTAIIEQTTNAQRSIVSSSASDTAAGTGARTVEITYLTAAGAGPFTETLTLNGTTPVNTVATNICYVESIAVKTVGSNESNVGTLSLKATTGGGGATIMSMTAGDNRTLHTLRYVPAGSDIYITSVAGNNTSTTSGNGAIFWVTAKPLNVADAVTQIITDSVRVFGQEGQLTRQYKTPIKILGPARIDGWVRPEGGGSNTQRFSFEFYEEAES